VQVVGIAEELLGPHRQRLARVEEVPLDPGSEPAAQGGVEVQRRPDRDVAGVEDAARAGRDVLEDLDAEGVGDRVRPGHRDPGTRDPGTGSGA
jgi:hypothetical protein